MDISLRAGRSFDTRDRGDSAPAVVMNEMLARRLWPDGETDAVGRTLMLDGSEGPYAATVVGVVEDSVGGLMLNGPEPQIFFPLASRIPRRVFLAVRTSGQPAAIAGSVRGVLASLDPNLVIDNVRPMTDVTAAATQPVQVASLILAAFGGFALLLAAIGVYGVVALASTSAHESWACAWLSAPAPGRWFPCCTLRRHPGGLGGADRSATDVRAGSYAGQLRR